MGGTPSALAKPWTATCTGICDQAREAAHARSGQRRCGEQEENVPDSDGPNGANAMISVVVVGDLRLPVLAYVRLESKYLQQHPPTIIRKDLLCATLHW